MKHMHEAQRISHYSKSWPEPEAVAVAMWPLFVPAAVVSCLVVAGVVALAAVSVAVGATAVVIGVAVVVVKGAVPVAATVAAGLILSPRLRTHLIARWRRS